MSHLSSRPTRPWAIVAAIPGHKPKAIARLCNRTDADDHCRFLQQRIPKSSFFVVFDPDEAIDFLHEQHKTPEAQSSENLQSSPVIEDSGSERT